MAQKLPQPIFTPATKADIGEHDENISFEQSQAHCAKVLAEALYGTGKNGAELAAQARSVALQLYEEASRYAATRGIIIADTKFEFGIDKAGTLHLIDEALTPDSSRFWPADQYVEGKEPAVLRQAVRARLPGDPGLEQDRARPQPAGRHRRQDRRQVPRGLRATDRAQTGLNFRHTAAVHPWKPPSSGAILRSSRGDSA